VESHRVVSRDEWIAARKQHLAKEKEFTRLRDQLSAQRRDLPWVRIAACGALSFVTLRNGFHMSITASLILRLFLGPSQS
jgi:predicted dithiol-disulfide oxidoreductase (DUF899 family)